MTFDSKILKMSVTARYDAYMRLWLKCEDGVIYSPQELELIKKLKDSDKLTIHIVKKVFAGTIKKVLANK